MHATETANLVNHLDIWFPRIWWGWEEGFKAEFSGLSRNKNGDVCYKSVRNILFGWLDTVAVDVDKIFMHCRKLLTPALFKESTSVHFHTWHEAETSMGTFQIASYRKRRKLGTTYIRVLWQNYTISRFAVLTEWDPDLRYQSYVCACTKAVSRWWNSVIYSFRICLFKHRSRRHNIVFYYMRIAIYLLRPL